MNKSLVTSIANMNLHNTHEIAIIHKFIAIYCSYMQIMYVYYRDDKEVI